MILDKGTIVSGKLSVWRQRNWTKAISFSLNPKIYILLNRGWILPSADTDRRDGRKLLREKYSMTSPKQEWMEMEGKEGAQLVAAAVPSATD